MKSATAMTLVISLVFAPAARAQQQTVDDAPLAEPSVAPAHVARSYRFYLNQRYGSTTERDGSGYYARITVIVGVCTGLLAIAAGVLFGVAHSEGSRALLTASGVTAGVGGLFAIITGSLATYLIARDNTLPPWLGEEVLR